MHQNLGTCVFWIAQELTDSVNATKLVSSTCVVQVGLSPKHRLLLTELRFVTFNQLTCCMYDRRLASDVPAAFRSGRQEYRTLVQGSTEFPKIKLSFEKCLPSKRSGQWMGPSLKSKVVYSKSGSIRNFSSQ